MADDPPAFDFDNLKGNFASEDVVVHPDRPWPWIGVLKVHLVAQVCTKCDLVVGYTGLENLEKGKECYLCNQKSSIDFFINSDENFVHIGEKASAYPYLKNLGINGKTTLLFLDAIKTYARLFHVVLWPTGQKVPLEGREKSVLHCSAYNHFSQNVAVQNKSTKLCGLVKKVHRRADVFIAPKNDFILTGVDVDKLELIRDSTSFTETYVVRNGLIGVVTDHAKRVYFRLAEGNELCAEYSNFMTFWKHETPMAFWPGGCDQLTPGKTVKIALPIMGRLIFPEENSSTIWHMFEKRRQMLGKAGELFSSSYAEKALSSLKKLFGATLKETGIIADGADVNAPSVLPSLTQSSEDAVLEVTISRVEVGRLTVRWMCKTGVDNNCLPHFKEKHFFPDDPDLDEFIRIKNSEAPLHLGPQLYACPIDPLTAKILPAETWRRNQFRDSSKPVDQSEEGFLTGEALASFVERQNFGRSSTVGLKQQRDGENLAILRVSPASCSAKLEVSWENGHLELNVEPTELTRKFDDSHLSGREFYPAMYVYTPKSKGKYLPDCRADLCGFQPETENTRIAGHSSKSILLTKKNHFGIVKKSDNAQKMAVVDFYWFDRDLYLEACTNSDLAAVAKLEPFLCAPQQLVSFYELRYYTDYNYYDGCMVTRLLPSDNDGANLGCVRRKNSNGSVTVSWYRDGSGSDSCTATAISQKFDKNSLATNCNAVDPKIRKTETHAGNASSNSTHCFHTTFDCAPSTLDGAPMNPQDFCMSGSPTTGRQDDESVKIRDLSSSIRWIDECRTEMTQPWTIKQLFQGSLFADDGAGSSFAGAQGAHDEFVDDDYQNKGYYDLEYGDDSTFSDTSSLPIKAKKLYSPDEHEFEDLESHYFSFGSLSADVKNRRMCFIAQIWSRVIGRLIHCFMLIRQRTPSPTVDRRRLVKLVINLLDTTSSTLGSMTEFWSDPNVVRLFDEETALVNEYESSTCHDAVDFIHFNRCSDRLVWKTSDRLYDYNDVMSLLRQEILSFKPKCKASADYGDKNCSVQSEKSEGSTLMLNGDLHIENTEDSSMHVNKKISQRKISVVVSDKHGFKEKLKETMREGGSADQSTSPEVAPDALESGDLLINEQVESMVNEVKTGMALILAIISTPAKVEVTGDAIFDYLASCDKNQSIKICHSSIDQFLCDVNLSQKFLLLILVNHSNMCRLPCFSGLARCYDKVYHLQKTWNNPRPQDSGTLHSTAQKVVESTYEFLYKLLNENGSVSCKDDDVFKICNDIGDSMCFAVLSILYRLVDFTVTRSKPIFETLMNSVNQQDTTKQAKETLWPDQHAEMSPVDQLICAVMDKIDDDLLTLVEVPKEEENCAAEPTESSTSEQPPSVQFEFLSKAPETHRFAQKTAPNPVRVSKAFLQAVRRDIRLLSTCLPPGIHVKAYEDRMDLISCMIVGPSGTPYAESLFFFDVRLHENYPVKPPHIFFKSMSKSLNPNLYEDGMVCLSLLGTWDGKETELWNSSSTLLQVFVSIQSLILVPEPYYNEPGFEKQQGTEGGLMKSREYNESAVLRALESLKRAVYAPPEPFGHELIDHVRNNLSKFTELMDYYQRTGDTVDNHPHLCHGFPLFPTTQGFSLCVKTLADNLLASIEKLINGG